MQWFKVLCCQYERTVTVWKYADTRDAACQLVIADGLGHHPLSTTNADAEEVPIAHRIHIECTTEQLRDALKAKGWKVTLS